MKKNDCNVIRDLMPLVLDRVASDESRALVEEHMDTCGKCRKQYEEMKAEMPGETRAEYEKEQKTIVDALKQARRKKRRRRILQIVLPAVISLAILIGGAALYGYLWVWSSVPVDNSLYTLDFVCLADGGIDVTVEDYGLRGVKYDSTCCEKRREADGNVLYLYYAVAPAETWGSVNRNPVNFRKYRFASIETRQGIVNIQDLAEIRQGKPGHDCVTLWKKGDPVPAASAEMEAYYAFEKEERETENPDGTLLMGWNLPEDREEMETYQSRREELYKAVPEWK